MADPFYRYQVPKLILKYEGSGNGAKTLITNISALAKSLKRSITLFTKYLGYELGAATVANDKFCTIAGWHGPERLEEILSKFTDYYINCGLCGNPETDIVVKKKRVYLQCKACGHRGSVDHCPKLSNYIIKQAYVDHKGT